MVTMAQACDVLIVDDDISIRAVLRDVLIEEQFSVECARNGAETLAALQKGLLPTVLLLDYHLPDTSGGELLTKLRVDPATRYLPVVMMSGDTEVLRLPVAAALRKPFGLEDLLRVLWPLVRGSLYPMTPEFTPAPRYRVATAE